MNNLPNHNAVSLFEQPITALPGVAGKRAALLRRLGIENWQDILGWFPRDFEDWNNLTGFEQLVDGEEQTFVATVSRKPGASRKGRLSILRTVLRDANGRALPAVWFNQPWVADRLVKDQPYIFRGRIKRFGSGLSVQNPSFEVFDPEQSSGGGIRPIYPLTDGLSQGIARQLVQAVLPRLIGHLTEPIPDWVRREHKLCAIDFAYSRIHQPKNWEEAEICRRRLAFEELFLLQAGLYLLRQSRRDQRPAKARAMSDPASRAYHQVQSSLPFPLTAAQQKTLDEVRFDLNQTRPMNRLVQGDVGSGKTVVAALAMLHCALCGAQAVLMAPTAILARQHHETIGRYLSASGLTVALLTGATPAAERKAILKDLADGSIQLLVGTHALIEDRVRFNDLALAVTDEQHRFGVRQRMRLAGQDDEAGFAPHVLVMSATPIPRTLALILYGDLDISVIDEIPAGRQPIQSYTARSKDRERVEKLIRRHVSEGRQAYIVCPMIEEHAQTDLESAVGVFNRLSQAVFSDLTVGLVHGGLKPAAKDEVMNRFIKGEVQILVSTTVIEVGIDNPNATLMMVENAERFGLSQLHQLRGRIGRGAHHSICILMSDSDDDKARERLKTLCRHQDGFAIAEKDLELRGPGDFFGTRQHGLPPLRVANLYRDRELLAAVQASLKTIFNTDPMLDSAQNRPIREALAQRYKAIFSQVGL